MIARKLKFGAAAALGFSPNDVYILKQVRHRQWLADVFLRRGHIPVVPLSCPKIRTPSASQHALARRIIAAYASVAAAQAPEVSPLWAANLVASQGRLIALLKAGDPDEVAAYLAGVLRSNAVIGIDAGSLYTGRNWRAHSLKILDDLASLAEHLGVTRTESGQASSGHAFAAGLETLVVRVEEALQAEVNFPPIAGAFGLEVGGRLIAPSTCEYLYGAARIRDAVAAQRLNQPAILEIGGGWGGTAYYLGRMSVPGRYTIIDLPAMGAMQAFVLGTAFGGEAVRLAGEAPGAPIALLPPSDLPSQAAVAVAINQNSLPEIPTAAAERYARWLAGNVTSFFYSYNHEAIDPSGQYAVLTVPELMAAVGGMSRQARTPSWTRPGYVEEVWTPAAAQVERLAA